MNYCLDNHCKITQKSDTKNEDRYKIRLHSPIFLLMKGNGVLYYNVLYES